MTDRQTEELRVIFYVFGGTVVWQALAPMLIYFRLVLPFEKEHDPEWTANHSWSQDHPTERAWTTVWLFHLALWGVPAIAFVASFWNER